MPRTGIIFWLNIVLFLLKILCVGSLRAETCSRFGTDTGTVIQILPNSGFVLGQYGRKQLLGSSVNLWKEYTLWSQAPPSFVTY